MSALGVPYVARWTTMHVRQMTRSISEAINSKGFSFIEVLSPCPPNFGKNNSFPDGLSEMEYFRTTAVINNDADLGDAGIDFRSGKPIILGDFVKGGRRAGKKTVEIIGGGIDE